MKRFLDRRDAGQRLAKLLTKRGIADPVVLALPRGGVPVAYEVAAALDAPLDVCVVRKVGVPGREELAMGAVASGGGRVVNEDVIEILKITPAVFDRFAARAQIELGRRERLYREGRPPTQLISRTAILVDDGLATGASMRAAILGAKRLEPKKIIVAVPVAARETCEDLRDEVDDIVCAETPEPFLGVGRWYEDFSQTSDEEVTQLLRQASSFGRRQSESLHGTA